MACINPSANTVKNEIGNQNRVYFDASFTNHAYDTRLVAYDMFGRIVGGTASSEVVGAALITNNYETTGSIILCLRIDDVFGYGDEFVLQAIERTWRNGGFSYVGAQGVFVEGSEEFITQVLSENLDGLIIDSIESDGEASYFGEEGACPFIPSQQSIYEAYESGLSAEDMSSEKTCTIPPQSWSSPVFDKTAAIAPPNTYGMFNVGVDMTQYDSMSSYQFQGIMLSPIISLDLTKQQYYFGVDSNGLIRFAGAYQDNPLNLATYLATPFAFAVPTAGFSFGDIVYFYFVSGDELYFINTGEGEATSYSEESTGISTIPSRADGGASFQLGMYAFWDATIVNVKTNPDLCPSRLNVTIWNWLDNIDEDLSQVPALQGQVSDYEEQVAGYSQQDAFFEAWNDDENAQSINNQIFTLTQALGDYYVDPADVDPDEEV